MKQYKDTPYFVDTKGNVYRDGKIRKTDKTGKYERIVLFFDNTKKKYSIHRIVAETYIPNPNNLPQVNHINGIKTDNRVENLEWVSPKENTQHAIDILGLKQYGEHNKYSILKNEDIEWIRNNCIPGDKKYGFRALSKMFNTDRRNINLIYNNKTWKHL